LKSIITVTLNPAFDIHYQMDVFEAGNENYVKGLGVDVGGKGINISRALTSSGYRNTAYAVLGRENCADFENGLKKESIEYVPIYKDGRIRENITLHPKSDRETRISLDSFEMDGELLCRVFELIGKEADGGSIVAFSGRLPRGVSEEMAAHQLLLLKERGVRLAIDCNSLSLDTLKQIHPWFIKPNEQEISAFIGKTVDTAEQGARAAMDLVRCGVAEQVMISLGSNGCAFSDGEGVYTVSVPKIEVKSTIGAGDSTVAGYLAAISDGADIEEALAMACAYGSAACLTDGTAPPKREDIEKIAKKITVSAF
jgi:1-phosphofructokinase family hexose kinase